jgi:hypothetical protein
MEVSQSTLMYLIHRSPLTSWSHLTSEVKLYDDSGLLKTASDGRTVLIPQPSDDPRDPLNWSSLKKHTVLLLL